MKWMRLTTTFLILLRTTHLVLRQWTANVGKPNGNIEMTALAL